MYHMLRRNTSSVLGRGPVLQNLPDDPIVPQFAEEIQDRVASRRAALCTERAQHNKFLPRYPLERL